MQTCFVLGKQLNDVHGKLRSGLDRFVVPTCNAHMSAYLYHAVQYLPNRPNCRRLKNLVLRARAVNT